MGASTATATAETAFRNLILCLKCGSQGLWLLRMAPIDIDFAGVVPLDFAGDNSGYGIYNQADGLLALSGWYPILAV